jgi:hypothetical protein
MKNSIFIYIKHHNSLNLIDRVKKVLKKQDKLLLLDVLAYYIDNKDGLDNLMRNDQIVHNKNKVSLSTHHTVKESKTKNCSIMFSTHHGRVSQKEERECEEVNVVVLFHECIEMSYVLSIHNSNTE